MKKNWFLRMCVELWGYAGTVFLFTCIWWDMLRWKLFWTGLFCCFIAAIICAILSDREKKGGKPK